MKEELKSNRGGKKESPFANDASIGDALFKALGFKDLDPKYKLLIWFSIPTVAVVGTAGVVSILHAIAK